MRRIALGFIIVCTLTGCGKEDESADQKTGTGNPVSAGAGKLTLADLAAPSDLPAMTRFEVISHMEESRWDFLATNAPVDDAPAEPEVNGCMDTAFSSVTISAVDDTFIVDAEVDLLACFKAYWEEAIPDSTTNITKASFKIYMQQTCVGKDLSDLNGKGIDTLETLAECDKNLSLVNTKVDFAGQLTFNGMTTDITSTSVSALSTAENEPCVVLRSGQDYSEGNGCVEITKSTSAAGSNEYVKYAHENLKWTLANQNSWYASGSIEVTLNAWAGRVSFRGAEINPLYTMTYGVETINGTLTLPSSGLSLHGAPLGKGLMRHVRVWPGHEND